MIKLPWFGKGKKAVGLDLGSSSVKVVELEPSAQGQQLRGYGFSVLPANKGRDQIVSAIKDALNQADVKSNRVTIALSGPQVVVRYTDFPKMTHQELANAIRFEAEQYMPFKKDEVFMDCFSLPGAGRQDNMMPVILVAAKKELVMERVDLLKEAGLIPVAVDVNSFCLMNCFEAYGAPVNENEVFALIEIGAGSTIVNIMKGRAPYFTREIPLAGGAWSDIIGKEKSLTLEQAEEWKLKAGGEELLEIIRNAAMDIVGEIRLCFDHYENQTEQVVNVIYLSGGSSGLAGIAEFLAAQLGIQVKLWNPVVNLKTGLQVRDPEGLRKVASQLAVATGLALRG